MKEGFSPYEEITRIGLQNYLNDKGIMQKKISQQTDISTPSICLFLSGTRPIGNRAKVELIRTVIGMEI
ncbi:hypothetical protein [Clostridium sp. CF012]|uniref:hypothetical protein n=1 Tax=Clostridium sp. CF012 TaxID=2843319 RepID=UPI001C0C91BC|nr:hypothetical protein [Clostridium sp. CF012]MBU3142230.1 hypothetical protein [Clostridium sp. CF012]